MRSLKVVTHLSNEEIQAQMSQSRNKPVHSRWQIIYLVQVGNVHFAELLAPLVNLT